jgi:hypothetical protein
VLWCLSAERAVAPLAKCGLRIRASFHTSMKLESCPAKSCGLQALCGSTILFVTVPPC